VSLGGRVYYTEFKAGNANLVDYTNQTIGTRATLGYPINELNRLEYSLGYEHNKLSQLQPMLKFGSSGKFMLRTRMMKGM